MKTKLIKIAVLVLLVATTILLGACANTKEDQAKIIRYLDRRFGKGTYTIKQEKYHPRWFVTLNQYPDISVYYTVSHDPLSMSSPYISTNFDDVFGHLVVKDFKKTTKLGKDDIRYDTDVDYVYYARLNSIENLKASYDRLMAFVDFMRDKYPIILEERYLHIDMSINGLVLKGLTDDEKYVRETIVNVEKGQLNIKSYEDLYNELKPKLKTHKDKPDGLTIHADIGRIFILGSDTFEDFLYKSLDLEGVKVEDLKDLVLQPGETSPTYAFRSPDQYDTTRIFIEAKNLTDSPCKLFDATLVNVTVDGGGKIFIDPKWIKLGYDDIKDWKDPYDQLKISPPRTEAEKAEGVSYKNTKILFVEKRYSKAISKVVFRYER